MPTMDDFVGGAKKYIDSATEKTNNFIDMSKLKYNISVMKNDAKNEYTKLGKLCYEMSEKGVDEPEKMSKIIARINKINMEIEFANMELAKYTEKVCPECGASNDIKFKYCSRCGSKLD